MRKQVLIGQFERRLVELGYPEHKLRRKVEELDLHHDNLKRTALKDGLAEPDAEARADSQLGDPVALAEEAATTLRQSSWWGRHPIIGYILLPLLALFPTLICSIILMFIAGLIRMPQQQWNDYFGSIGNGGTSMKEAGQLIKALFSLQYLPLTLLPIPFCWMARRSASGMIWASVPCLICAVQGMSLQIIWPPHQRGLPIGYFMNPNWPGALGPLLIAGAGWLRQALALKRLAPLPEHLRTRPSGFSAFMQRLNTPLGQQRPSGGLTKKSAPAKPNWVKKALRTPTYWVIIILLLIFISVKFINSFDAKRRTRTRQGAQVANNNNNNNNNNNIANLKTNVWPAERETTIAEVKARQANKETHNETIINLRPHINVQLEESVDGGAKGLKDNHLQELPYGVNIYGGVPFDVRGRIQLMGRGLEQWKLIYPVTIKDIQVGRKCAKIHLFHGESCNMVAQVNGQAVAKLILHYTDDSEQTIEIISGEHVLDWWGPIYTTGAQKDGRFKETRFTKSPDAELAWIGKNPWINRYQPDFALRLYKTTFANPRPDLEITTIEYISTMSKAAPFLLGMTVE